jgi:hypothetical protein
MGELLKIIGLFPRLIEEEDNQVHFREVTKSKLLAIFFH